MSSTRAERFSEIYCDRNAVSFDSLSFAVDGSLQFPTQVVRDSKVLLNVRTPGINPRGSLLSGNTFGILACLHIPVGGRKLDNGSFV